MVLGWRAMALYTKLLEAEINEIINRYNLELFSYEPIEQGFANSNYLIDTNCGKYILTIFEIEYNLVVQMSKVLQLLEMYQFPAPRLQPLVTGETITNYKEKPVLVKPYITGRVVPDLSEEKVRQVGIALARLHQVPAPDYLADEHTYVVDTYPQVLEQGIDQHYKNWLRQRCGDLVQKMPSKLPVGLVHGDLFYDNVLFEGENFKAILDFEHVSRIYKVFDLGMAAVGLCVEGTKILLKKVNALVDGYQKVRQLEACEKESLQTFVEYSAILTSTWRFLEI